MNNNDISLFEKVVFVDKIDNEYDAQQLSNDYPFAYIITDKNMEGLTNGIKVTKNNEIIKEGNISSGNIWKGGQRLTKFINVDNDKNTITFDSYDLKLEFNQASGLLSFYKIPKIEDYKLAALFYKTNNDIKVYANKNQIENDIEGGILVNNNINLDQYNNIVKNEDEQGIITYNLLENESNPGLIDAVDNKVYIVLRFESRYSSTLNNVNIKTFNINPENEYFSINQNAKFFVENKSLDEDTYTTLKEIFNNNIREDDVSLIKNVTYDYNYTTDAYTNNSTLKYGKYIIYELNVKKNKNIENNSNINFNFENAANLSELKTNIDTIYVNPTSYKLFIGNNEVDLTDNSSISTYFLPDTTYKCTLEMEPINIRNDLFLHLSLDNSSFFNIINENTISNNNIETNKFIFYVKCKNKYIPEDQNTEEDFINLKINNNNSETNDNSLIFNKKTKIKIYKWVDWEYTNPFDNIGNLISGKQLSFNTGQIFGIFDKDQNDNQNNSSRQRVDVTNLVNASLSFTQNDLNNNINNNNGGLPSTINTNKNISIYVPFIFKSNISSKIKIIYSCTDSYLNTITSNDINSNDIIADKITSINIENIIYPRDLNNNIKSSFDSGSSVKIFDNTINNSIIFKYQNIGEVNVIDYLKYFNDNFIEYIKNNIEIGVKDTSLENPEYNHNGKNNLNNNPYINIQNNSIIYNSDDNENNNDVNIEIRFKYFDQNYSETIRSYPSIIFTINKLIIDWWMYLGEIKNVVKNSNDEIINYEAVIPSFPQQFANSEIAQPHSIIDDDNRKIFGGILYKYTNNSYINSIESNETFNKENSFGNWIHLGSLENMKENNPFESTNNNYLYNTEDNPIFCGNTKYYIMLIPNIISVEDGISSLSWNWDKVTRPMPIYNKGQYKGWVFEGVNWDIEHLYEYNDGSSLLLKYA